jgi:hypothetical protein
LKKTHISIATILLIVVIVVLIRQMSQTNAAAPAGPISIQVQITVQPNPAGGEAQPAPQPSPTPRPRAAARATATTAATQAGGVAYDPSLAKYLPDPKLTPGDVLDVTPQDFCVSGYSSKVRDVPQSVKDQAYQEYGITSHQPGQYEVDHLISLELGGSNSIRNLWPESYTGEWNAREKDKLENKLHELVCSGSLDMKTAQQAIATNWIAAYEKYVK